MKVALQEPLNQRFILLSEAGIPLYPPTAMYFQLMSEKKSRINSCTPDGVTPPSPSTLPVTPSNFAKMVFQMHSQGAVSNRGMC